MKSVTKLRCAVDVYFVKYNHRKRKNTTAEERNRNMRYLIFVSHGELASGMCTALTMLVGERDDVFHVAFQDGMGLPEFKENVKALIEPITNEDEVIVMADLISGSPLTTTMEALAEQLDLTNVRAIGGMNLPLAVTAIENEDEPLDETVNAMIECAVEQIRQFSTGADDADDGDDI